MKISVTQKISAKMGNSLLVVPIVEGQKDPTGPVVSLDKTLRELIASSLKRAKSKGKEGEIGVVHPTGKASPAGLALMGVGKEPFTAKVARKYAAGAVKLAVSEHHKKVILMLPQLGENEEVVILQAITEGALLGGYRFMKYKSEKERKREKEKVSSVSVMVDDEVVLTEARNGVKQGEIYAHATEFARELVNEPAGEMTPSRLVEAARSIADVQPDSISLKVMDRAALKKMGAGGVLGVAQGSDEPPYMIHLTYKPAVKSKARVAVVGKGITFDSGGLSLKPAQGMEDMKIDMSGAAAMLGAMSAIAELAPDIEVHGIAGVCENMPSGHAIRPGDVVTAMSGKTIEILNTDAEGRVTLADTLHYGAELEPDFMVDLATLTGACVVALGQEVAGLMTNSDGLAEQLLAASDKEGEMIWRLPLPEEYDELIKSPVADIKNISSVKYGGAITAGLFLKHFVGDTAWAHLDIAGPAWAEKETVPHQPRGATGFGVRTVLRFIESL
ncbi:MAG: leucyl aminopeptidase [Patescibacteria group bacterium]|nr:leucyl aminopeptidase [Patescibacteria group bacterium]